MVRKKQIIIPIAILIIGIASYFGFASLKKPPEQKADVDNRPIVAVDKISLLPLTLEVDSYGVVKPKYETTVVAQVSGEIVEISEIFVKGGFIKKNQLLARIDPNDYRAALIDAESNMASAKASLETEQAQGKVAEKEWKQITDASPTELSLRKPQLAQELARVKSAQASILRAKRNLQRTEIRAPYDAIINKRSIGLGSFVGVGTEIGKLSGTGIAEVRLPVADNQLQFLINQGQQANVSLTGTYAGKNSQWVANIIRSEGVIDDSSRMSYLVAEIEDPYNLKKTETKNNKPLRFGSYVNAKIEGYEIDNAGIVPRYLVVNGRVPLLSDDSKLHYAEVEIVRQQGENVVITNGLNDGDKVIISALDYPVDGMKLALAKDKKDTIEKENSESEISSQVSKAQVVSNDSKGE